MVAEERLCFRLRDEENEWILRVTACKAAKLRLGDDSPFDVQHEMRARIAPRHERVTETETLEKFQGARLHAQRARLVGAIQPAIDDARPDAEGAERRAERQPGRPRSHDQNVGPAVHHQAVSSQTLASVNCLGMRHGRSNFPRRTREVVAQPGLRRFARVLGSMDRVIL